MATEEADWRRIIAANTRFAKVIGMPITPVYMDKRNASAFDLAIRERLADLFETPTMRALLAKAASEVGGAVQQTE